MKNICPYLTQNICLKGNIKDYRKVLRKRQKELLTILEATSWTLIFKGKISLRPVVWAVVTYTKRKKENLRGHLPNPLAPNPNSTPSHEATPFLVA